MRCKSCNYRLWGIRGRECPECGTRFLPSEFEFVPNSVRFCCPHCQQDYYGASPSGHLEPRAFQCVSCAQPIQMDEMTLFPTAGLREEQTQVEQMPWLERGEIGFLRGWFRTVWMGMLSPTRLVALTPRESSAGSAFWFATLTAGVATIFGMLPFLIFPFAMGTFGRGPGMVAGLFAVAVSLAWPALFVGIWGAFAHAVLSVTGKRDSDAWRTYQAMCYSAGPGVLTAVPCMGFYLLPVAWIWWSISAINMLRAAQRVSGLRATAAVLCFPVLACTGLTLLITLVVVPQIKNATSAAMQSSRQANLSALAFGLIQHAKGNGGKGPSHMIELAATGSISPYELSNALDSTGVPVGSGTLQDFIDASLQRQTSIAKSVAASLPPNVIAHRLGDYVFTYHGIDFNKADRRLWVIVLAPAKQKKPPQTMHVALADGTTMSFPAASLAKELTDQNSLRAKKGLPPLPDPSTVTHTKPAVAAVTTSSAPGE
jgi:hypothetical protein